MVDHEEVIPAPNPLQTKNNNNHNSSKTKTSLANNRILAKPDEDAEAHLLCSNDWMNAHHFVDDIKV